MPASKIKMLNFITHFGVGGTERQFVYLTKGLDRSRFDVRLGCMSRVGDFLREVEPLGLPISEYPTQSLYSPTTVRRQLGLVREIHREGIQLVHAYGYYPTLFAIPAAKLSGKCVAIASVRDMGVFNDRERLRALTLMLMCRLSDCVLDRKSVV